MQATTTVPLPIAAGDEMAALSRFFRDVTWTGTILAGAMAPGSPAMTASGSGTHVTIQDGVWIVGDYAQDQFLADGTFVLRWELHWVVGWDPVTAVFRATLADNYGRTGTMTGWIEGDRLVFESAPDEPVGIRLTWDLSDPTALRWRNEAAVGGPYRLIEEYLCTFVE